MIEEAAKKFTAHEAAESGGHGTEYGIRAWEFVFRQLTDAELSQVIANGPDHIFSDHSGDPLWEKVQDTLSFWEEWSFGELCEELCEVCDNKSDLADPEAWEYIFNNIQFSRADYDFCIRLLHTGSEDAKFVFFQGSEYGDLETDPRWPEIKNIAGDYDPLPLFQRIDEGYCAWADKL